ncbi:hypothetical protein PVK06_043544 [Gossypium arboreum]|uniref:Alcohol dehydrogenase-like C-terminal domain-containing protein n=1 Tax=Gossypium arboreum TaxID=29729 RepID=A0ABR0MP33_GOSAR|nr:hypothetical protein PVK06_043544 [Gossypium arboreum]
MFNYLRFVATDEYCTPLIILWVLGGRGGDSGGQQEKRMWLLRCFIVGYAIPIFIWPRMNEACLSTLSSLDSCKNNLENYCPKSILTYGAEYHDGSITYGGYFDTMVADELFFVRIPDNLSLDVVAPLLCAGITVYSPLRYYGLDKPGLHVGVVGLGGLGHVAVKFAKAMGAKVTVISTSPSKKKEALENLGADSFFVSRDQDQLQFHGKLVLVGALEKPLELPVFPLLQGRKVIGGSMTGGMKETQEMIDFVAKHNLKPDIEVIAMEYVNTSMERLLKADVKYRFVIDIGNKLKATTS